VIFEGGWELFGVGTFYPGEGGPHIHYHASVGRAGHALTGCLREEARTYLIVEAVILEFTGLSARREFDEKMQLHLPVLNRPPTAGDALPGKNGSPAEGESGSTQGKDEPSDELPGSLAEIIRDLTRRPSG
jgi:hypothetical protein